MAMKTLKSISTALELVEEKKTNLQKAFEQLQSQSSLLSSSSSFSNIRWEEIDSHFTTLYSNLIHKFSLIQSLESEKPNPDSTRPELKSFFENMDGLGLRKYILENPNQRGSIRTELTGAWKHAPDPADMVLNAMNGFFRDVPGSGSGLGEVRRACLFLLEEFMKSGMEIGVEAKEKARALVAEWKKKMKKRAVVVSGGDDEEGFMEKVGYMHLLAAFGLVDDNVGEFEMNELIEFAVRIANYRQAVELCRVLGLGERISEVVNKLIEKGKRLLAVKFILHFELTEKFPPLPLLETYLSQSKELTVPAADEKGKNNRQAPNEVAGEIVSLNSVIKYIEDHNLESKYPKDSLLRCVKSLEKGKNHRNRSLLRTALKARQFLKKPKKSVPKHSRRNGAAGPSRIHRTVAANATVAPLPQQYVPYAAYGVVAGSRPAAITYEGASTGIYGLSGTHTGYSGNVDPSMSSMYPSEAHVQPSYYDRSLVYGGHAVPSQYHPAYYPQ